MKDFKKNVYLGKISGWDNKPETVHAEIRLKDGNLAITGVIGAMRNGDCTGSCGQCHGEIRGAKFLTYGNGWDAETVTRFLDAWDRWHLNDMHAGCIHRREDGSADEILEITSWKLTSEAHSLMRAAEAKIKQAAHRGEPMPELSASERFLLGDTCWANYQPDDVLAMGLHKVKEIRKQRAGNTWPVGSLSAYHAEHPRGLLGVPCSICGHKYGSAWLREEVPEDVLEFLSSLPDASYPCPWGSLR